MVWWWQGISLYHITQLVVEEHNGLLRKHNYQVRQMIGLSHGSWHSRAMYLVAEYCDGLLCKHNYKVSQTGLSHSWSVSLSHKCVAGDCDGLMCEHNYQVLCLCWRCSNYCVQHLCFHDLTRCLCLCFKVWSPCHYRELKHHLSLTLTVSCKK